MAAWWRSNGPSIDDERLGVTRRRFLRAAGVGTAGAVVAAGAVAAQAGTEPAGLVAAPVPSRRRVGRLSPQGTEGAAAVQAVSGPLSLHTISPKRYVDTRYDGGGPFPPQGATGEVFIWDFGLSDFFPGGVVNEVPENAVALAFNLTATGGRSAGNLRAFPANLTEIPRVSNVNWATGQTVANFAVVAAATGTGYAASVAFHNASAGSVHAIVDIFGYFV
jgi:hypothetical protein